MIGPAEAPPRPAAETLPALLDLRAAATPHACAYAELSADDSWRCTDWAEHRSRVSTLAQALSTCGLKRGERLLLLAPTGYAWERVQMAALACGAVVVGVDPRTDDAALASLVRRIAPAAIAVQDKAMLARLPPDNVAAARLLLALGAADAGMLALVELESAAVQPSVSWSCAQADDPAFIVFTSGTTGEPKGITYTHRQVCMACAVLTQVYDGIGPGDRLVCWLPMANLFQRMVNFVALYIGASTYYVDDPRQLMALLPSIRPHLLIGVPRFYEKLYAGMMARVETAGALRPLLRLALRLGAAHAAALRKGRAPLALRALHALVDPFLLARFRRALGGEIKFLVSGSAPMPLWLLERLHGLGLLVLEAYGTSEDIIPIAANTPRAWRFGTVGRPLPGNTVRLSATGEVEVSGPGVFAGYLDDPDRRMFTADGFLRTGDEGEWCDDGFLRLTGRCAEIFKTSTGRRVAPAPIEARLAQLPWVEQALVAGAGRPYIVALLTVDAGSLARWARAQGLPERLTDPPAPALAQALWQAVEAATAGLAAHERPAGALVRSTPFSVEAGELTVNLKLRRKAILARHSDDLARLYADIAAGGPRLRVCA